MVLLLLRSVCVGLPFNLLYSLCAICVEFYLIEDAAAAILRGFSEEVMGDTRHTVRAGPGKTQEHSDWTGVPGRFLQIST